MKNWGRKNWLTIAAGTLGVVLLGAAGVMAYQQNRPGGPGPMSAEAVRDYVMDFAGTETPFSNAFWNNHEPGLYVEARTGEALFASSSKFESGSGWPSFTEPVNPDAITLHEDNSGGMRRIEVRSAQGGAHLGHLFLDGPQDRGGRRFCMNSASLRFIPRSRMQAEGYGQYIALVDGQTAQAEAPAT